MSGKKYIIGIDGGGTKTDIALAQLKDDGSFFVLSRKNCEATNPNDVGAEKARERLSRVLKEITEEACISKDDVVSIFGGIAGCLSKANVDIFTALFNDIFPDAKAKVESDAANSIALSSGWDDGCCLIAGTGSAAFVRKDGVITNIGGWGYLVDDEGSGFSIGQDVLKACYRQLDGRGENTLMTEMTEKKMGKNLRHGLRDIYLGGKSYIASFAPIAFDAYRLGDKEAEKIIKNAENQLYLLIEVLIKSFRGKNPTVSMCGGMFKEEDILLMPLKERCGDKATLIRPTDPPVYGALIRGAGMVISR